MRLTLRTLLAYLDDALEPAQAKLIGQKVAESEAAQELIGRIKQVTRRRRLTTPPMTGPSARFDPNTIAEYLDNVLPAEQVAELEETCLASDVHLAEVAACHQVLTLFLGEPALVPPTARQRMYGLIRGREAIPYRKVSAPAPGQRADEGAGAADGEEEGTLLGLSFYRRDGNSVRWLVGAAAAGLLLGAAIAIWMAIAPGSRQPIQARGPIEETPVKTAVDLARPRERPAQAEPAELQAELLPAPKPDTEPGTPAEEHTKTPSKSSPAQEPTAKANPPSPTTVPPASTERTELGKAVLVPPTVLLQRPPERETWQRLRPQTRVSSNDYLVSLPGYRSELRMDSGVHLVLWGNLPEFSRFPPVLESAVGLHVHRLEGQSPFPVDLDLTLDHGRVVFSNHKREGPARILLRFSDEVWELTLPDQNTEVAAELVGICLPYNKEPGGGEPEVHLALLGLKGQAQVKIRYEQYLLPSPSMLTWDNLAGTARSPVPLPRPPDWWSSTVPLKTPMQTPLEGLTNRLALKNIDVAIAEAKNSTDPSSRVLALRCLGAMANYSSLLDCLADDKHPDVRMVAIDELRHLLGLNAQNDEKLRRALKQKNFSDGQAQTILQLVHGVSLEQWANPTIRTTAVEYLMHDKLAIRQLTHTLLLALEPEGRKIPYDPAGDSDSRERGHESWKKLVLGAKPPKVTR
jgi:hypothetical protein